MRNIYILFFILFLTVLVGGASVFITHTIAQDKTQQAFDVACIAQDVASFKDCIQQLQDNKTDFIKITEMISCTNQNDCAIRLTNIRRPVIIYGSSTTQAGFIRTENFNYSLFTLQNVSGVNIGGFLLEDRGNPCENGFCSPLITVQDSENVLIESLHTISAINTAVFVSNSKKTAVRKSLFDNSQTHAVVIERSSDTSIEDTTFSNSWSNALVFSSQGTNIISRNTFLHNQSKGIYQNCGSTCTGAQLIIAEGTGKVLVEKNKIKQGSVDVYDTFGLTTSGIELAGSQIEQATLRCNEISSNSGNGIVLTNRNDTFKSITVEKNSIFSNGIDLNVLQQATDVIEENCLTKSCRVPSC